MSPRHLYNKYSNAINTFSHPIPERGTNYHRNSTGWLLTSKASSNMLRCLSSNATRPVPAMDSSFLHCIPIFFIVSSKVMTVYDGMGRSGLFRRSHRPHGVSRERRSTRKKDEKLVDFQKRLRTALRKFIVMLPLVSSLLRVEASCFA